MKESNSWDAKKYSTHADFVSNLALPLIDLLAPKPNEYILDLGCGDGTLALEIQKYNAKVIAVDLSEDMVKKAKSKGLEAYVLSATNLEYKNKFNAVFSNAVLHWVKDSNLAIKQINKVLKPNGRFVAEFGAEHNIEQLVDAIKEVFLKNPQYGIFNNPWNFQSETIYEKLLKNNGFKIDYMEVIKRPTAIDDISNWLDIFANGIISNLNKQDKISFKNEVKDILKPKLYSSQNGWVIDYVRLKIKATKV